MSDNRLRQIAWLVAVCTVLICIFAGSLIWLVPDHSSQDWMYYFGSAFATAGAPIMGLLIVVRQPRQRIGWLWLVHGLARGLTTLGQGIFWHTTASANGFSAPALVLMWLGEAAAIPMLVSLLLLLLWFPDGRLHSRRWRFLHLWVGVALVFLSYGLFSTGPNWNGGEGVRVYANPFGWLPDTYLGIFVPLGFFSLVLIYVLALPLLVVRYRTASPLIRLQLRWFIFGGFIYVLLDIGFFFLLGSQTYWWSDALRAAALVPLYLAVAVAILRYRLYDIDVIIRKTLVYTVLSGLLALVYFGLVILLQNLFDVVSGQQSPLVIVVSTLIIAALFGALRQRVQAFIDRRFYRQKYDAQQVLAQFAQTARDEVEMDVLQAELLRVVQETLQPDTTRLWLKPATGLQPSSIVTQTNQESR